jgi:hypothetical protein
MGNRPGPEEFWTFVSPFNPGQSAEALVQPPSGAIALLNRYVGWHIGGVL